MWEYLLSLFHLLLKGEKRFHCHLKYDIILKYTLFKNTTQGLPSFQLSLQCRRPRFDYWVRKIP